MITNVSKLVSSYGRSDRIRTCGILLPKQARYHLRYTPMCSAVRSIHNVLTRIYYTL